MNKNRIAVFIDWFRPGYKAGGPITSCANMVDLLRNDFHFYIFTKDRDYMDDQPYVNIATNTWLKYSDNCDVWYISPDQLTREKMGERLEDLNVDLVYINGLFSKHFSIWPMGIAAQKKVVLAPRGMLRPSALAIKGLKKSLYLYVSKLRKTYKNVIFQATTELEKKDIEAQNLGGNVLIAHNSPKVIAESKRASKQKNSLKICFAGRIAREKNLLYALSILKHLDIDHIELSISGEKYDQGYWKECEKILNEFPEKIKVRILGSLSPDRFEEELRNADVMFLPTRGENFGHVIHESLAVGTPVIISDQTPWRGLDQAKAGRDLALQDPESFQEAIKYFWAMDEKEYEEWSLSARKFAMDKVDMQKLRSEYIRLFE